MSPVELEICISRQEGNDYSVDLRVELPNDSNRPIISESVSFNLEYLLSIESETQKHGRELSDCLFKGKVLTAFNGALDSAREQTGEKGLLQVRLLIGKNAQILNDLQWETLTLPNCDAPLCMDESISFSRYFYSNDLRRVKLRPKTELKALIVAANPNQGDLHLDNIDVAQIIKTTKKYLDLPDKNIDTLGDDPHRRATINKLEDSLTHIPHPYGSKK